MFKPMAPPSRLNALVLSGQASSTAQQVAQFCSQSLAKWFATEALQEAKQTENTSWKKMVKIFSDGYHSNCVAVGLKIFKKSRVKKISRNLKILNRFHEKSLLEYFSWKI